MAHSPTLTSNKKVIDSTNKTLAHASAIQDNFIQAKYIQASPLQKLHNPLLEKAKVTLYVKRDDLIHPEFGGNKWRKLKHNLTYAKENGYQTLLTFGGAWSNHIYATAAAGKFFGFNTIGLIRGEEHLPLNETLSFAQDCGMQLHYLDRVIYRDKDKPEFLNKIKQQFGNVYILPEGGSNPLAIKGCREIIQEINSELKQYDVICCASGTGATLAGLISEFEDSPNNPNTEIIGFSALKGGDFLINDVKRFLKNTQSRTSWSIETKYHFGGYAKINNALKEFMKSFEAQFKFQLDAVYTSKMFYGLFHLIENNHFEAGTTIVAIHSGGIQGNRGFNL